MSDAEKIRAEIDAAIEGKTTLEWYARNATEHGDMPALTWKDGDTWRAMNWRAYRDACGEVALGLVSLGIEHGDFVAIMARNIPEHVIADGGAVHASATPVSIYNTLASDQIAYIAKNCGAKVAILENRDFAKRWADIRDQLPDLKHIVMINDADDFRYLGNVVSFDELRERGRAALAADPDALLRASEELTPDDPATLVYTSGTTGPPKGVVITHRNIRWVAESFIRHLPEVPDVGLRGLSYLPLAHVAERFTTHYIGLHRAGLTFFCPEISGAMEVAQHARPDAFLGVPRVWEKLKAGIEAGLAAEHSPVKKFLAKAAIDLGVQAVRLEQAGKAVPPWISIPRGVLDKVVCSKIRAKVGLDRAIFLTTGSAPIARDVLEFFHGIGLKVLDTWGMTELTVLATFMPPNKPKFGTVGTPIPGIDLKIAEDGEILVRGGIVTNGYHKRPEATAETYIDGWVHSGDLGSIDAEGYLSIVGRKKEIIITAGGKNISPINIEALLKEHPLIGQACLIGDARKFVSALVTIDTEVAPGWAKSNGVPYTDLASFAADPRVIAAVQAGVDDANRRLSQVEAIKRFAILPTEWTADSGELTPTLKLKRSVVHERFGKEIEALYA